MDMGVDGIEEWYSSRDEAMAYCEEHSGCDTAACDEKNVLDHDHCERLKYGDLRERYENEVIYANHDERISFLTVVNVICGNVDVECAYAAHATVSEKPSDYNLPDDYFFVTKSWGSIFYKVYSEQNDYNAAKTQCESDGAFLAIPRSEAENDYIGDLIPNAKIWIGINDIDEEGVFVAVDGSDITYTNWNSGEPNNSPTNIGDEEAVHMHAVHMQNTWNDQNVHELARFVCSLRIQESDRNRTILEQAEEYCHQTCHSGEMDRGIDDFVHPCSNELWEVMEGDDHWDHWDDDDHWDHWDDDDHHWEDNDHHWDHNDHDWNQNFAFADPMDAIGNMLGGFISEELGRIEKEMICTSANYMSLAAENENFPIPQVPLGPTLDWREIFGDLGDLDHMLGELPFELPGGPMWRSNGDSFNFTFTPAMTDFRKQILERAFGPDMANQPL